MAYAWRDSITTDLVSDYRNLMTIVTKFNRTLCVVIIIGSNIMIMVSYHGKGILCSPESGEECQHLSIHFS